jgi:hypothetical protein
MFTLGASMTKLTMLGLHDTVSLNGGTDMIVDTPGGGDKLQLQIGALGGTVDIINFGVANAVVDLDRGLASSLGWTTPTQVAAAVSSSDVLSLGRHFGGLHPTATNFHIG